MCVTLSDNSRLFSVCKFIILTVSCERILCLDSFLVSRIIPMLLWDYILENNAFHKY